MNLFLYISRLRFLLQRFFCGFCCYYFVSIAPLIQLSLSLSTIRVLLHSGSEYPFLSLHTVFLSLDLSSFVLMACCCFIRGEFSPVDSKFSAAFVMVKSFLCTDIVFDYGLLVPILELSAIWICSAYNYWEICIFFFFSPSFIIFFFWRVDRGSFSSLKFSTNLLVDCSFELMVFFFFFSSDSVLKWNWLMELQIMWIHYYFNWVVIVCYIAWCQIYAGVFDSWNSNF